MLQYPLYPYFAAELVSERTKMQALFRFLTCGQYPKTFRERDVLRRKELPKPPLLLRQPTVLALEPHPQGRNVLVDFLRPPPPKRVTVPRPVWLLFPLHAASQRILPKPSAPLDDRTVLDVYLLRPLPLHLQSMEQIQLRQRIRRFEKVEPKALVDSVPKCVKCGPERQF